MRDDVFIWAGQIWEKGEAVSMRVIVVGGGWAGCAAAVSAKNSGAQVILCERTDMLLGTGLVGGIVRNNARFTAAEEMIALGGGALFEIMDANARHTNIDFPGHRHASLYDIAKTPAAVHRYLTKIGVDTRMQARVTGMRIRDGVIEAVRTGSGDWLDGDAFVDCTGTAGPMNNCTKYGNGCAMCILRCPSFGGRVSLTAMAGVEEQKAIRSDGTLGAMSGACKLHKDSLSPELVHRLEKSGVIVIPLPEELREDHLVIKACQQYAQSDYVSNLVLLDTGHAKLMTPYFSLARLRMVAGFENARYEDPYAGGKGNSVRLLAMAPRDETMKVRGVNNLFCAGEKAGPLVGHTEAVVTGTLAGYNAVRHCQRLDCLVLPRTLAVGEALSYVSNMMQTEDGLMLKYTFSGSVLWEHIKALGLYTTDVTDIRTRVHETGLAGVFSEQKVSVPIQGDRSDA